MLQRLIQKELESRLATTPAVAVIGPRQCGKTTLARSLGGRYFDLEQEADCLRLDLQWDELIEARELVVLDEAQSWPQVFPRLRGAIDADRRRKGRFLVSRTSKTTESKTTMSCDINVLLEVLQKLSP